MGDSGSDDEDTSWESKWTEKQEKYKAYAVSKLQKHLAEIQEDIDKYDVKLEKLCLLYTSPSPRDKRQSRMPSSA